MRTFAVRFTDPRERMKFTLLPRSLFWRVLGVIAIGLLLLQSFSFYLSFVERDRVIAFSSESFMLDRFVQLVDVVESLPPEQRSKVLKLFGRGPFTAEIRAQALSAPEGKDDPRAREIADLLRVRLGRDRVIETRFYQMEFVRFAMPFKGDRPGLGAQRFYRRPALGPQAPGAGTPPGEEAGAWYEQRSGTQLLEGAPLPDPGFAPSLPPPPGPRGEPGGDVLFFGTARGPGGVGVGAGAGPHRQLQLRSGVGEVIVSGPRAGEAAARLDAMGPVPPGQPGMRDPGTPAGEFSTQPAPSQHDFGDAVEVAAKLKDGQWLTFTFGLMHRRVSLPPPQYENWALTLVGVLVIALVAAVAVVWPLRQFAGRVDDYAADLSLPPMKEAGPREVISATRALNRLHERLATLLRTRTQMLTAVSHDLKTPVTRLRLRAELLDEGELKDKINGDLDDMEALIGSTLDYFRAGTAGDSATRVDVSALVREIVDEAPQWQGRVTVASEEPIDAVISRPSLRRVLTNLIDNAVKYGGAADISVRRQEGRTVVSIRDRGPGIPPAELDKVFEPFYRVEASRNRATGGSGLGLAIAREIAQASGASITLRNADPGLEAEIRIPR